MTDTDMHDFEPTPRIWYLGDIHTFADLISEVSVPPPDGGLNHDALEVYVSPVHLILQRVQWTFPGGPMQHRAPAGPRRVTALDAPDPLGALLHPDERDHVTPPVRGWIQTLVDRRRRWSTEVWRARAFSCFVPRREDGLAAAVLPVEADWFELPAGTRQGDAPDRTLRLGRTHDQLVDDHGRHWRSPARRLTLHATLDAGTPAGAAVVTQAFGAHAAEVAAWFAQDRAARFNG